RTLVDIVRSCVLTIFACIYTALHPNIPDPKASDWQKICRRLKMSFYMLTAPEAVIWWAMRQWYGARRIARVVNYQKPDLKWTTMHGHFVQMGGLEGVHPDGRREVIAPLTLLFTYLGNGRIDTDELRFPKKQVEDRSKGDFLSKGLVTLQTSWFVIECIARSQQHLPITKLEVVTLAFAVLNIITYGFWWDKPLNVNCQVEIHIRPEVSQDGLETKGSREGGNEVDQEARQAPEASSAGNEEDGNDAKEGGDNQESSQLLMTPGGQDHSDEDTTTTENGRNQEKSSTSGNWLLRLPRWAYDGLIVHLFMALVLPIQDMFRCFHVEKGARHVPMFYGYYTSAEDLLRIRLMACLIGMILGAIHFIPWNSHFPTHVELVLWRSSSLLLFHFCLPKWGAVPTAILKAIRWVLYVLGPILYVLARVSLIIQAFISLRGLQPDVFQNVTWTSYIPHL
ncbi:hypothetical protein BDN72DRAFT_721898, partial [Pluteus cervinus]